MPEYLAPGVYVEEVDTGSKPIEGVSTSTCGLVGVTERGPADVPVLITSVGEYARWFGGQLRGDDFGPHRYLPHAVEGFFTNGGKRVYVVRALDTAATKASAPLFDRAGPTSVATIALRPVGEGTGSAIAQPGLLVLPVVGLGANDWVRIGDGSRAEFRQAAGAPVPETIMVAVDLPLGRSHAAGESTRQFARTAGAEVFTMDADAEPGDQSIVIGGATADVTALATAVGVVGAEVVLELGTVGVAEYREVRTVTDIAGSGATRTARVGLGEALLAAHAAGDTVTNLDLSAGPVQTATITEALAGSGLLFVDDRQGDFDDRDDLVFVGDGALREIRRIGELSSLAVFPGTADDLDRGARVEVVQLAAARTLSANAAAAATELVLQAGETAGLSPGEQIVVAATGGPQTVTILSIDAGTDTLTTTAIGAAAPTGATVIPAPQLTTAAAAAGAVVIAVNGRTRLSVGDLISVGSGAAEQFATVTSLPARTGVTPDAGNVVFTPALAVGIPSGTPVQRVDTPSVDATRHATALVLPAPTGTENLIVTDGDSYAGGDLVRLTTIGGDVTYHRLTQAATALAPEVLELTAALTRAHPVGTVVVGRAPLVDVQALDAGAWGDRLRISVTDDVPGLVSRTTIATIVNPTTIRLASRSGVQAGTVLEVSDAASAAPLGDPVKVSAIDRVTGSILLAGTGLAAAQQVVGAVVRSREFTLTVSVLRQPDPATPSRDGQVIDRETFRNLSLDPRHSNYIEKIVGSVGGPLRKWDRRPEGSSLYIRVTDLAATAADQEETRLGPEPLFDRLPDGRLVPAMMRLETVRGDDSIGTLTDAHYLGADNADPELRTGLQGLRNIEEVSIVAIPGRVSPQVQQGLIDHCELMRYRFAVLDTRPEPADTVSDAQDQRQQFDTKYAALYYPWLAISDPFPVNLAEVKDYAIPPSGHMLGVYARTDIERGVHKAPANEVVRGITGLRRKVNKEQQDILNPYPVNINVIRDFRDNNRGVRVYGGRVITSDPDWKYVNVRRLLIFIEASIERGLQWVVFEPNSEPLWARVRRTISDFLTVVWRNGALEGTKPEEAFFVRCDRTTMTQADIDNGRLIVQVGVAPVKPAEFVIVRIGLWTARSDS
jgi:phage tail sheath protein FI